MEAVLPPFHHNPTAILAPDGHVLLFFIGADDPTHQVPACPNATAPKGYVRPTRNSNGQIVMAWAPSVEGPWQQRVILPYHATSNPGAWDCQNNNPTATIMPNGTVLLVFRANPCEGRGSESLGIATAPHWSQPFTRRPDPVIAPSAGFGNWLVGWSLLLLFSLSLSLFLSFVVLFL